MRQAFIGIDVGTSSARAGVFDELGTLLATARHPITVWHEAGSIVEQSSSEIWAACAAAVRAAMAEAALPPSAVRGLGFDATCSLVVLDAAANPLTVSTSGDERRNIIVWMDHRAIAEARLVNDTHDEVLRYVGGSISPEMEIPKLLWLKRHLPSTYNMAGSFLRSRRLSFVSRHRVDVTFDLHARLQMEFPVPRASLEQQLFRAHRSWRSRIR